MSLIRMTISSIPAGTQYRLFRLWLLQQVQVSSNGVYHIDNQSTISLVHMNDSKTFIDYLRRMLIIYKETHNIFDESALNGSMEE